MREVTKTAVCEVVVNLKLRLIAMLVVSLHKNVITIIVHGFTMVIYELEDVEISRNIVVDCSFRFFFLD